jgi:hypothetical protein
VSPPAPTSTHSVHTGESLTTTAPCSPDAAAVPPEPVLCAERALEERFERRLFLRQTALVLVLLALLLAHALLT